MYKHTMVKTMNSRLKPQNAKMTYIIIILHRKYLYKKKLRLK